MYDLLYVGSTINYNLLFGIYDDSFPGFGCEWILVYLYLSIYLVYLSICMYLRYVGMYLSSRLVVCMGAGAAVKRRAQGDNHAEKSDKHLGIYLYKRIQRECYLEGPKEVLDRFTTACLEAFGRRDETIFKLASENYS